MSEPRRTVRRREGDDREERRAAPVAEKPAPAPVTATAPARGKPTAPKVESMPFSRLDVSDLEALASMDPSEMAALYAGSEQSVIQVGQRVTGRITRVGADNVFVDVGAKSEAMLERLDVPDAKPGDEITAFVLEADENGIVLSKKLSGATAGQFIVEAHASGMAVEGKVASRNSGGYEVRIGAVRAFCPASQIDRRPDADPDSYIGNVYEFKVVEVREGGDAIVSRRALLDANIEERRDAFWQKAAVGQTLEGYVTSVQPFGVFVDVDGIEGLVPKRELAWDDEDGARYGKGAPIKVKIIDLDPERRKITLSAKDESASPWLRVGTEFVSGGVYEGTVTRLTEYGAFIELAPGLQGLLHASRAGGKKPTAGEKIQVRVGAVDRERQRIELSAADLAERADKGGEAAAADEMVKGKVQQVLKNGIVVDLEGGRTGWIPANNIELPAGTVLAQRFRPGKEVQARVVEADPSGRRVTLTLLAQTDDASWRGAQAAPATAFGTFADLLKGVKAKK